MKTNQHPSKRHPLGPVRKESLVHLEEDSYFTKEMKFLIRIFLVVVVFFLATIVISVQTHKLEKAIISSAQNTDKMQAACHTTNGGMEKIINMAYTKQGHIKTTASMEPITIPVKTIPTQVELAVQGEKITVTDKQTGFAVCSGQTT